MSKKIAIITLHSPMNCGSVLQAFALNKYINTFLKQESFIIDYNPPYFESEGRAFRNFVRKMLFAPFYFSRKKKFRLFVKSNDVLSQKKYKSFKELYNNPPKADVFLVGSDQLWNPCFKCGNDPAFFIKFIDGVTKISYSTSLGSSFLTNHQLRSIVDNISDFYKVSVREKCSANQLNELDTLHNIKHVCDPTLLLQQNEYDKLAIDFKHLGDYVAVYLVEASDLLNNILDYYRKRGLKIVGVGGYKRKYKCDLHIMDADPAEFLGLIRDASVVVATSFHACVFSNIYHKDFYIIPPPINVARIEEFLFITGHRERIINSFNDFEIALSRPIDYVEVQERIDSFVLDSKQWLLDALEIGNEE